MAAKGVAMFDTSFVRQGKTLAQWLPELVADDRTQRHAAAEAIGGMWQGKPSYNSKASAYVPGEPIPDFAAHAKRFSAAIRDAVEGPDFPKAMFVRRLMLLQLALDADWLARVQQMTHNDPALDAKEAKLIEAMVLGDDEAAKQHAAKRFARFFCATLARDKRISGYAEGMQPTGIVSSLVMDALDTALLAAPDTLNELLDNKRKSYEALRAIERMGISGRPLIGRLLRELEFGTGQRFDGAAALGSIAHDDAATADRLIHLLKHGTPDQVSRTLMVLNHLGPHLSGRTQECVDELLKIARPAADTWLVIPALASVGREDRRALQVILNEARPRPPVIKRTEDAPHVEYNAIMYGRGGAIDALRHFRTFVDEVGPVLIDALDTFEEYDPDWGRQGDHARVLDVLESLGAGAIVPAIPTLVGKFRKPDGDIDWAIIRLFGSVGPMAASALPALLDLHKQFPEVRRDTAPNETLDHLGWAIARIRGEL